MSLNDLKTQWEVYELYLKCLAIVIAGAWAVWLFFVLRQREAARAELRKTEVDIRTAEADLCKTEVEIRSIELQAKQQAVIEVELDATTHATADGRFALLATATLTNKGSRNTRILWKEKPPAFKARPLIFNGVTSSFGDAVECRPRMTKDPERQPVSHIVRAGGCERIAFALEVPQAGIYLLTFRGTVDEEERAVSMQTGAQLPVAWTAGRYIVIG
jgi:hypothetical protein